MVVDIIVAVVFGLGGFGVGALVGNKSPKHVTEARTAFNTALANAQAAAAKAVATKVAT